MAIQLTATRKPGVTIATIEDATLVYSGLIGHYFPAHNYSLEVRKSGNSDQIFSRLASMEYHPSGHITVHELPGGIGSWRVMGSFYVGAVEDDRLDAIMVALATEYNTSQNWTRTKQAALAALGGNND